MSPDPRLTGAEAALRDGDADGAIRLLSPVLREEPDLFRAHLLQARAYHAKAGRKQPAMALMAVRAYEEALRCLPPEKEAHLDLITLAMQLHRGDALLTDYPARFGDLPFAAETAKGLRAAVLAAPVVRTPAAAGSSGRLVPALLAIAALAAAGWWTFRLTGSGAGEAVGTAAGAPVAGYSATPYEPGLNIVENGDGSAEGRGWTLVGPAHAVAADNPYLELAGDAEAEARAVQTVRLPSPAARPRYLLLVTRALTSTAMADGETGRPRCGGRIVDASGRTLVPFEDPGLAFAATPGAWGACGAVFEIPQEGAAAVVELTQGLKEGAARTGVPARFDDVAMFLFQSAALAREFAARYDGWPPTGRYLEPPLAEAAPPPPLPPPPPPTGGGSNSSSMNREENLNSARALYDRLEPGQALAAAAQILEGMAGEKQWTRDFGQAHTRACLALNVYFHEGRVARVDLTEPYDEQNAESRPGKVVAEKGQAYADWQKGG